MGFILSRDFSIAAKKEENAVHQVLVYIATNSDDQDREEGDGKSAQARGRNFYHSLQRISRGTGIKLRTVRRAMKTLKEMGWIREYPTKRYRETHNPKSPTATRCYELNLSMLARRLDISKLMDTYNINPEDEEYEIMLDITSFQHDDWETRVWVSGYVPRSLDWDGDIDSLTPDLWKTSDQESDSQSEHQSVTNEEINTIANRHRIQ